MTLYIVLTVLSLLVYAAHEFSVTRNLRPSLERSPLPVRQAPPATAPSPRLLAPHSVAAGRRLAFNGPNAANPVSLTRKLKVLTTLPAAP
jgi:hypothetical protein